MENIHDQHFYNRSLEYAKISRATHDDILQLQAHEIQSRYNLSQNWKIDRNLSISDNELGVKIYTLYDDSSMELSISFHSTPSKSHLALLADGEILREAGWYAPAGQGEQLVEMQRSGLQATGLLNDEWHPQFALALSEAKRIKEQYEAAGYLVSVTGHGAGGSIAQLASYTLDLPGNAFDPLGAKNLTESRGYAQWCRENGIDPQERAENSLILRGHGQQRPGDRPFTNYELNASKASDLSGEHLGPRVSISNAVGRETLQEKLEYAKHLTSGVLGAWSDGAGVLGPMTRGAPALKALKDFMDGADAMKKAVDNPSDDKHFDNFTHAVLRWADTADPAQMDRIVRVFEKAVRDNKLPQIGETPAQSYFQQPAFANTQNDMHKSGADPRHTAHPLNPLWLSSESAVERLDSTLGRTPDIHSQQLTGSVFALAAEHGLCRVDHVLVNNATADTPAGCRVFAVQGDPQNPAHLRAGMDMQTALSTPLEQAFNQAQQAVATLSPQQDLLAQSADEHSQRISAMH